MRTLTALLVGLLIAAWAATASAAALLTPGDTVLAVGSGPDNSSSPANEQVANAIDGTLAKYLNFGGPGSGFIVTPAAASVIQSFVLTTANDSPDRDPTSYALYGTNVPIASTNHSTGLGESWTLISQDTLTLPTDRNTVASPVNVTNTASYSSYKLFFPTLAGTTSMQIGEAQFYTGPDAGGSAILAPANPILAIDAPAAESSYPVNENPHNAIDGAVSTKYLNFSGSGTGLIVVPSLGSSIVTGLQLTTANDAPDRDPTSFEIYGTNDPITSTDNSAGVDEHWTLIAADAIALPTTRHAVGDLVEFTNTQAYSAYKVIFPTTAGSASMQIAELYLDGQPVPEPAAAAMLSLAGLTLLTRRRRC